MWLWEEEQVKHNTALEAAGCLSGKVYSQQKHKREEATGGGWEVSNSCQALTRLFPCPPARPPCILAADELHQIQP